MNTCEFRDTTMEIVPRAQPNTNEVIRHAYFTFLVLCAVT